MVPRAISPLLLFNLASRTSSSSPILTKLTIRLCSAARPATTTITADRCRRSSSSSSSTSDTSSIRAIRLKKVQVLRSKGHDPYAAYKWDKSHTANQLQDIYAHLGNGEECKEDSVSIAGRIIGRRVFCKLAYLTLRDDSGTIQLYFEKEILDDQFEHLKSLIDIGDIVGACGSIKKTNKGALSVKVKLIQVLTKSLLPLPEKFHGLTDIDKRYRQRYIDMIANPEVADVFRTRAKIVLEIRRTMDSLGFIEVETPVFQGVAGGAEARPFITYHNSLKRDLYMRIATELHLKRMLVGGIEKVFELGRIFRNEGISTRHNPEFTTIEMYEAYSDYESMMNLAEEIITKCALAVHKKLTVDYQGTEINLERPWRRETMHNLVNEATGIDFNAYANDVDAAKEAAIKALEIALGNKIKGDSPIYICSSVGHILNEVFEILVEPTLIQPTFVLDYPIEISPLAKPHRRKTGLTERFELFICGREIGNAYSELTDPVDQRARFEEQIKQHNKKREALSSSNKSPSEQNREDDDLSYDVLLDEDFITALEYGMPPASGMGLGIDRLVMLLTNSASIRDVIAYPVLKLKH